MAHIVLLGDSVFDNAVYSAPEPGVADHLRGLTPEATRVTLLAVDGSVTRDVDPQIGSIPADATHLVLSSGGNDALALWDLLSEPTESVGSGLVSLAEPLQAFARSYRGVVEPLVDIGLPLALCTVYDGNMTPDEAVAARMGVALFDDAIQRVAAASGASILELRSICSSPQDYANPIEPSGPGGRKIAEAIATWVEGGS